MKDCVLTGNYWPLLTQKLRDSCYNGMGAEWMPKWSRWILDFVFRLLQDGVRIHDVEFAFAKKTRKNFYSINRRMKANFLRLAKSEIPWWRWHKRRRFLKYYIPLMYAAVNSELGWKAFTEASPPEGVNL